MKTCIFREIMVGFWCYAWGGFYVDNLVFVYPRSIGEILNRVLMEMIFYFETQGGGAIE